MTTSNSNTCSKCGAPITGMGNIGGLCHNVEACKRRVEKQPLTLEQARQLVVDAGYKLGVSHETEQLVYACSLESVPGTFGHPRYEVTWNKEIERRHVND